MNSIDEEVSGSCSPRSTHPHNGYFAGDFSSVPFRQPDLRTLLVLNRGIAPHLQPR